MLSDYRHDLYSLDHVEDGLVVMEPDVVVRDCHLLEGDLFGVFEVGVGLPNVVGPGDGEKPVVGAHVARKPQTVLHPALGEKYVRRVRLQAEQTVCVTVDGYRVICVVLTMGSQLNESSQVLCQIYFDTYILVLISG